VSVSLSFSFSFCGCDGCTSIYSVLVCRMLVSHVDRDQIAMEERRGEERTGG